MALGEMFGRLPYTMTNFQTLVTEFDITLVRRRFRTTAILQQLIDLFLEGATSYSDDQIAVFGLITNLLIGKIERQAVIELSSRPASADHAAAWTEQPQQFGLLRCSALHLKRSPEP